MNRWKAVAILFTSCIFLNSCGVFGNKQDIPTIPLPAENSDASNLSTTHTASDHSTEPSASQTVTQMRPPQQRIQEDRSEGGTVDQIKVNNPGNIPDYYIYPSQGQNLNINSQPDKNLATPSWQISW